MTQPEDTLPFASLPEETSAEVRGRARQHDELVSDKTRQQVLERDDHQCQVSGCYGPQRGGTAELLVQPVATLADEDRQYAVENLETRCLKCACWVTLMPQPADLPPALRHQIEDVSIKQSWIEILQYLHRRGPAGTTKITEAVTLDSNVGVRNALYSLMSLDVRYESVTQQIVARDYRKQVYGLANQIPADHRTRGRIPAKPDALRSRVLDEIARRLYDHLNGEIENPDAVVAAIVDRGEDQIRRMRRRAQALQFPFDRWADTSRSTDEEITIRRVVTQLAGISDDLSRASVADTLADASAENGADQIAEALQGHSQTYTQRTLGTSARRTPSDAESRSGSPDAATSSQTPSRSQTPNKGQSEHEQTTSPAEQSTGAASETNRSLTRLESVLSDIPREGADD